ncbi:MAG: hypothetical protein ACOYJE_02645 [Bacteroidaceae bacterium]
MSAKVKVIKEKVCEYKRHHCKLKSLVVFYGHKDTANFCFSYNPTVLFFAKLAFLPTNIKFRRAMASKVAEKSSKGNEKKPCRKSEIHARLFAKRLRTFEPNYGPDTAFPLLPNSAAQRYYINKV